MTRQDLEHILRASGAITNENTILIIGSQSVLGKFPRVPDEIGYSNEADVFPIKAKEKMELINGSIGEITQFHETYGYYAHGLPPESCSLPKDWNKRLHSLKNENTGGVMGLCLDPTDLAVAKLVAGREKDLEFVENLLYYGMVTKGEVESRIKLLEKNDDVKTAVKNQTIVTQRLQRRPRLTEVDLERISRELTEEGGNHRLAIIGGEQTLEFKTLSGAAKLGNLDAANILKTLAFFRSKSNSDNPPNPPGDLG